MKTSMILKLGLVHAAVEMIEEHLLGQGRALAEREELQHLVLLARQMHPRAVPLHRLVSRLTTRSPVWITDWAWPFERRTMAWMRATSSSLWNGFGHVVVGAEAETPDLVLDAGKGR